MSKKPSMAGGGWKNDRRSRQERGYGAAWQRVRKQALARDMHLCQPCKRKGRTTPATEVDHIIPKAEGGTDDLRSLQSICASCHSSKTAEESARAQGRTLKPKSLPFDAKGRPIWGEDEA